jgi:hypothetical protein
VICPKVVGYNLGTIKRKEGKDFEIFSLSFLSSIISSRIIISRTNRSDFSLFPSKEQIRELHVHHSHNETSVLSGTKA